jgi:hypothetical protein
MIIKKTRRQPREPLSPRRNKLLQEAVNSIVKRGATRKNRIRRTGGPNQCQCLASCPFPSLPGKAFCKNHIRICHSGAPLTEFEPDYLPKLWNKNKSVRTSHNCFIYAFNIQDPRQLDECQDTDKDCDAPFHQPGLPSGYGRFRKRDPKTCPNMISRIKGDNPSIKISEFGDKCPSGYSKIATIVDENEDFHFLRQDSNRFWSHKPGGRSVINTDSGGHLIWNPELAEYNWALYDKDSNLNYDIFCGYLCVPRNRPLYVRAS